MEKEFTIKDAKDNRNSYLLVGGYTTGDDRGIIVYSFDRANKTLNYLSQSSVIENPSYLCIDGSGRYVYVVSEKEEEGEVYAYIFEPETGQLTFKNKQPVHGGAPCYVSVDEERRHIFTANYKSGSLAVLPLNDDGSLQSLKQLIQDEGDSVNAERQEGPHVHTAFLSPDGQYLLYTNLGTDQIHCCRYETTLQSPLEPVTVTNVKPGSGPRHLDFSKDGKHFYVVTELSGDVLVFDYNAGNPQFIQMVTMLAEDFEGEAGGGDIHVSPNGLFVYASNRGDANEVVVFSINQQDGKLTFVQRNSCMGKSPRNLVIDPTGAYLLVANQDSNNIVAFALDQLNGMIGEIIFTEITDQPSCLKFV
jgi:6-phosphogluconolactonase